MMHFHFGIIMNQNPEGMRILLKKQARFQGEVKKFQDRWTGILEEGDPYYNKNFPVTIAPFTLD